MKDHILREDKFFQTHDKGRTWQRYCGFLDLSISEFLDIQEGLLLEQIDLVAESPLGRTIMKDQKPTSLDEFRRTVPLTTYDDYLPYIGDGQETYLAEKPYYW
ncbi:MAG: GH3 auxin-responsive promoter family protein, partial [Dehalococcoidia bacterium]